jgi:hypothetical protein
METAQRPTATYRVNATEPEEERASEGRGCFERGTLNAEAKVKV